MNQKLLSIYNDTQKPLRFSFIGITCIGVVFFSMSVYFSLNYGWTAIGPFISFTITVVELFLLAKFPKAGLVGFPIVLILGYLLFTVQFLRDLMGFVGPNHD